MKNNLIMEDGITQVFVNLIKYEVQLKHPDFRFGRGTILYDELYESYIYTGFSKEEINILKEAEKNLFQS